jgi:hypothetical protein
MNDPDSDSGFFDSVRPAKTIIKPISTLPGIPRPLPADDSVPQEHARPGRELLRRTNEHAGQLRKGYATTG